MAHTPGPWETSGVRVSGAGLAKERLLQVCDTPTGRAVAFVIYSDLRPADHIQAHADQRLIAAAPDMLAALRLLTADVAEYEAWKRPCHALDVAQAAIAKAEGR